MADEDEEALGGLYDDGHWIWSDTTESLMFVSDAPPVKLVQVQTKVLAESVKFRDDIDVIEQVRYRRRYQRKVKPGDPDIVTLQDVKDIAIYTAPTAFLSPALINMLHLPTTERFLRALILFCAYYLQIADEMAIRMIELETKLRTPYCDILETEYRDNLADLRVLVAKEYSVMIIGGGDVRPYHHMGPNKKSRSLSNKDANFFETFLRMSIQIVWLALGRKSFMEIDLEVNRLFKSDTFNTVEHKFKTKFLKKIAFEERSVLLGHCLRPTGKLQVKSPLMCDLICHRPVDYRLLGLGVVKCSRATSRLNYLLLAVHAPEDTLTEKGVVLGIIGMPRNNFDAMLNPLPMAAQTSKSKASALSQQRSASAKSTGSVKKSMSTTQKLYPNVVLPEKTDQEVYYPPAFPDENELTSKINEFQRRRWLDRLKKLKNH